MKTSCKPAHPALLKKCLASIALMAAFAAQSSQALDIVLTNDDGWTTANIQVMFAKLKAAGHDVILSGPCTGQSGKGGALNFLRPVSVDLSKAANNEYCVGDTDTSVSFKSFSEGTPVMASLYGIDVVAQAKWGHNPDLVISGPNEGNNLGYLNNSSGTLGAAMSAIVRGIPAIAVSAADGDETKAGTVADIVLAVIEKLEANRTQGQALLPPFTGLNVNTPSDLANHRGIKFTDIGWNTGSADPVFTDNLASSEIALQYAAAGIAKAMQVDFATAMNIAKVQYTNKAGLSFSVGGGLVGDSAESSEGVALTAGFVTISTIDAHIQASRAKVALTQQKLHDLVN
jgi:5'-nucleotidase